MNRHPGWILAFVAFAAFAVAGCPAGPPGTSITVTMPSPGTTPSPSGTAGLTPSPTGLQGSGASATPLPQPSASARPLGPGPTGGSLEDVAQALGEPVQARHRITFSTTQGDFVITLFPERAVAASAKFLALCNEKFYENTTFHRVIPGFVAQGGDYLSKELPASDPRIGTGNWGEAVPDDFGNGLKHLPGAVAFAHTAAPNSSYSQFYISLVRLERLDAGYTVFGQVIAGWDAVERLTFTVKDGRPTGATPDRILQVTVAE